FQNKKILQLASKDDLLIQPMEIPGPLCAILGGAKVSGYPEALKILNTAASICAKFTVKENKEIKIQYGIKNKKMEQLEKLSALKLEKILIINPIGEHLVQFQI
ncbi:MAG: hypothetical protein V1860_00830, partial [bacterium]